MTNTNRVFKNNKVIHWPSQTVTADAILALSNGLHMADISDVAWERIIIEFNVTAMTGTNFVLDLKTTNDKNFDGSNTEASNVQAVQADGSTAVSSATITGTGRYMFAVGRTASAGATASNVGKYIGLFYDHNATSVTLSADVYIEGR